MKETLKRLDLSYLADLIKNNDDEDKVDEILQEYAKKFMVDSDELEEILATDWNCIKCSSCGRFFGEDEISDNDEDCIFCV